jgi:hypothetical protein
MPQEFGRNHFSVAAMRLLDKVPENAPMALREKAAEEAARRVEVDVFGEGFRRDRFGKPIEQGIGAPGKENEQHFAALEKYEGKAAADAARAKAKKAAAP